MQMIYRNHRTRQSNRTVPDHRLSFLCFPKNGTLRILHKHTPVLSGQATAVQTRGAPASPILSYNAEFRLSGIRTQMHLSGTRTPWRNPALLHSPANSKRPIHTLQGHAVLTPLSATAQAQQPDRKVLHRHTTGAKPAHTGLPDCHSGE